MNMSTDPGEGVMQAARDALRLQGAVKERRRIADKLEEILREPKESVLRDNISQLIRRWREG